jgi:hypothetical protein
MWNETYPPTSGPTVPFPGCGITMRSHRHPRDRRLPPPGTGSRFSNGAAHRPHCHPGGMASTIHYSDDIASPDWIRTCYFERGVPRDVFMALTNSASAVLTGRRRTSSLAYRYQRREWLESGRFGKGAWTVFIISSRWADSDRPYMRCSKWRSPILRDRFAFRRHRRRRVG